MRFLGDPPLLPVERVPAVRFSGLPADIVGGGYYCSQTGALIPQWLLCVRETVTVCLKFWVLFPNDSDGNCCGCTNELSHVLLLLLTITLC